MVNFIIQHLSLTGCVCGFLNLWLTSKILHDGIVFGEKAYTLERESIMRGARANPSLGLFGKWNGISASHTPKGSQESIYLG